MVKFPDGTVRVLVEGLCASHQKFAPAAPYLRANYELLRDETETPRAAGHAPQCAQAIRGDRQAVHGPFRTGQIAALNTEHPGHFADLIAANLSLSLEDRQGLLETVPSRRFQKAAADAQPEQEVLTLSSKIQSDVSTSIAKTQRDFFLREQMRAIQRELGEGDANAGEAKSLAKKSRDLFARRSPQDAMQELERSHNAAGRREYTVAQLSRLILTCVGQMLCRELDLKGLKSFEATSISVWQ